MGGMGNQLWQYSFGRSLSLKYKKTLVLDISFYNNEFSPDFPKAYKFNFELDKFNLHKDVIIETETLVGCYHFAAWPDNAANDKSDKPKLKGVT